ncbi:MAG: GspMb/PilO family protein [Verrucomicrobiota bacterium]
MNRLTPRERRLFGLLAALLILLANGALLASLARRHARLRAELAARRTEVQSLQTLVTEGPEWAARAAWLDAHQPRLTNPEQAAVQLLEQIKAAASAQDVLLEAPELGGVEARAACQSVSVQCTAKSSWPGLVRFLHALQQPDRFLVFETASIQSDPANASRLSCRFKISKWYAPPRQRTGAFIKAYD